MKKKINMMGHIRYDYSGEFQNIHVYEGIGNQYQCPMKCEGNKIYEQPGYCPVCNMKLVPVQNGNTHAHHHH